MACMRTWGDQMAPYIAVGQHIVGGTVVPLLTAASSLRRQPQASTSKKSVPTNRSLEGAHQMWGAQLRVWMEPFRD